MAEQTRPVRRKVALKIIKPGMDSKDVIARFEAERQALALMDHPNIAKVLDGGTTGTVDVSLRETNPESGKGGRSNLCEAPAGPSRQIGPDPFSAGRPYFVMELIHGVPITDFCDDQRLPTQQRLELFTSVCRAVQHAHQKGIIHRDLKPSNILISMDGDRPIPKVIDFGIAKALSQQLTDKTLFTAYGQMVGTPLYMSPEQAQLSVHDVDTRSDVYSLGVLLYQLLTGTTPFDKETLQQSGFDEMRRIIREVEPPRPSTRINTLAAESLTTVSNQRAADPRKLSQELCGELDWIVMKTLEKDRARRYESASALAEDVQHYLDDEAVEACPPSVGYRLSKFSRRNKGVLITTALVVASLLVGTGVSAWQAVRATNEARRATQAEQLAGRRLGQVDEQRKRAEGNVQLALDALEQVYLPLAESQLDGKEELSEQDRQLLEKTLPFYETLAAQTADDPEAEFAKARAYQRVGNIYASLHAEREKNLEQAEKALRQTIALFEGLVARDPNKPESHRNLALACRDLGQLLAVREPKEAERNFRRSIAVYENILDDQPYELLLKQRLLAERLLSTWGRSEEALKAYEKLLASSARRSTSSRSRWLSFPIRTAFIVRMAFIIRMARR